MSELLCLGCEREFTLQAFHVAFLSLALGEKEQLQSGEGQMGRQGRSKQSVPCAQDQPRDQGAGLQKNKVPLACSPQNRSLCRRLFRSLLASNS